MRDRATSPSLLSPPLSQEPLRISILHLVKGSRMRTILPREKNSPSCTYLGNRDLPNGSTMALYLLRWWQGTTIFTSAGHRCSLRNSTYGFASSLDALAHHKPVIVKLPADIYTWTAILMLPYVLMRAAWKVSHEVRTPPSLTQLRYRANSYLSLLSLIKTPLDLALFIIFDKSASFILGSPGNRAKN
jgi:hypothetical protein